MESCLCGWLCSLGIHGLKGIRRIHGLKETVLTHNEILMRSEKKKKRGKRAGRHKAKKSKKKAKAAGSSDSDPDAESGLEVRYWCV